MKLRVALLVATLGLGSLAPAAAAAEEETVLGGMGFSTFDAVATAEGFRYHFGSPGFLVVERYVDFGAPVASSSIDSLGRSQAFASDPYPGETFIAGPGTVSGVTGLPNPGNYPFFVASSYPATPDAKLTQPGYELAAHSEEVSSNAKATHGGTSGDSAVLFAEATSAVRHAPETGVVEAVSAATARSIEIGGVLRIGSVNTSAKVTQAPGAEAVGESTFQVDAVSIAGQPVGISAKGLTMPGGSTPLPDGSPLVGALKGANISVRYLEAVKERGQVTSPGLVVTQRFQVPAGPEMTSTLVLGRAVARVAVDDAAASASPDQAEKAPGSGEGGVSPGPAPSAWVARGRTRAFLAL